MSSSTREELLQQFTEIEERLIQINSEKERLERKRLWHCARKETLRAQLESMIREESGTPLTLVSTLDTSIEELGLSKKTKGALDKKGIKTIGDLKNQTEKQLRCIPKIADVSIMQIKDSLLLVGYTLKETISVECR